MKKNFKKLISIFLSVVMVITFIPTTTYAMEEFENDYEFSAEDVSIEYEVESKRTENSKTYLTEDGGYYQVSSAVPIHEEINGEWENMIDVDENVETSEDAEELVRELASSYSVTNEYPTGIKDENSNQNFYGYPYLEDGMKKIDSTNDYNRCVYITPSIVSEKSVYIYNATIKLSVAENSFGTVFAYYLNTSPENHLSEYEGYTNVRLSYNRNMLIDRAEPLGDSNETTVTVDITKYSNYCSLGIWENYGIALTSKNQNNESTNTDIAINNVTVTMYYREIGEVDNNIGCETIDLGRGGTVYINDYSCTPIVVRNDLGIFDELEEVDIQTIINPIAIDEYEYDGTNSRTNYYSTLKSAGNEFYWKNCEGNYVIFTCINDNDGLYTGYDCINQQYNLVVNSDNIKITKLVEKSPTYTFIQIGDVYCLEKYNDGYNNTINIDYENEKIQYIEDGSKRKYKFLYNENTNLLDSISVYYDSNGVEEPIKIDNQDVKIEYEYDDFGRFKAAKYFDGYQVQYEYMSDNSSLDNRLSNIIYKEIVSENVSKTINSISFEYFEDTPKMLEKYSFNCGNTIETMEISNINRSLFYRTFKKTVNSNDSNSSSLTTNKIVKYDAQGKLQQYKSYDNEEYFLDYENRTLNKIILNDTSSQNLINNGDFNNNENWELSDVGNVRIVSNAPDLNNNQSNTNGTEKALKITTSNAYATQNINQSFSSGSVLVLSCSARCEQTLPTKDNTKFYAKVSSGNSTLGEIVFDDTMEGKWQKDKIIIKLPIKVNNLQITIGNLGMPGICYFDSVELYSATSKSVLEPEAESNVHLEYNDNGTVKNIIKKTDSNGNYLAKHFEYDENNYISSVDEEGIKCFYKYDEKNGLLISKGKNIDNSKNARYSYDAKGTLKMVSQIIDSISGEQYQNVEYLYDDSLIKTISHNGCVYEYSYNDKEQITSVKVKDILADEINNEDYSVSYNYTDGKVGKVMFGNGSSITYTYNNSIITSTEYDNGKVGDEHLLFKYLYKYDDNGNLISMKDETNDIVSSYTNNNYTVTKNSNLIYSNNGSNSILFNKSFSKSINGNKVTNNAPSSTITCNYSEDELNRISSGIIMNKIKKGALTYNYYKINSFYSYVDDNMNNSKKSTLVKKYTTSVNKRTSAILDKYEDTRLKRIWFYEYDEAGRVSKIYKKSLSNVVFSNESNEISDPDSYTNSDLVHYYEYDNGGEISKELDLESEKAIFYTYDAGGNLTKKLIYNNKEGVEFTYNFNTETGKITIRGLSGSERIDYVYKNSGMTDYLTRFNGNIISYDSAGNPVRYAGKSMLGDVYGDMEWNGNLLTSFSTSSSQYVYTYDGDGRRTSKIYYGYKDYKDFPTYIIDYIWEGDTLVGYHTRRYTETNEKADYELIWDKVIKLNYNNDTLVGASIEANTVNSSLNEYSDMFNWSESTAYSFISDGQGNITDVYDFNEKIIVSFSYDAYGNITPYYSGTEIKNMYENSSSSDDDVSKALLELMLKIVLSVYLDGMFLSIEQGYKGCLYDKETGLYYSNQRYYSPSWGRFINANDPMILNETIGEVYGCNLFNYCKNDPVNNISKTGFNAPCVAINDNVLPALGINDSKLFRESRSAVSNVNRINTRFSTLGFALNVTQNNDCLQYYDVLFNKSKNIVDLPYGPDYVFSRINMNTSTITKYNIDYYNTPYKIAKSVE